MINPSMNERLFHNKTLNTNIMNRSTIRPVAAFTSKNIQKIRKGFKTQMPSIANKVEIKTKLRPKFMPNIHNILKKPRFKIKNDFGEGNFRFNVLIKQNQIKGHNKSFEKPMMK